MRAQILFGVLQIFVVAVGFSVSSFAAENISESLREVSLKAESAQAEHQNPLQIVRKNSYAFVFYFASWCEYCRTEVSQLKKIQGEFPTQVALVGLSGDENESNAKKISDDWGLPWPIYWDSQQKFRKLHKISKIPFLFFVDSQGQILAKHASTSQLRHFFEETRKILNAKSSNPPTSTQK